MAPRYRLTEVLGSGACAHVVVARRRSEGPEAPAVALKVLRPEWVGDAPVTRRFRDEARILLQLDHPNVVRARELLDYDGRLVLEMELVEGGSLDRVLGMLGPAPAPVCLGIVRASAEALRAAWEAPGSDGRPMRIVHRDLKPANIALSVGGAVKLLDFGYAKGEFEGRAAMSLHDVWGTIGFDAPERKRGETTPAADVYALGVTLYVALTTRALLLSMKPEHHDEDLLSALDLLEPDEVGPGLPAIRALIGDCVRYDASARPAMASLIARIDAIADPEATAQALRDFGAGPVRDLWSGRPRVPAENDGVFGDVRFLQEHVPQPVLAPMSPAEARVRLEALLAQPGWEGRVADIDPLIDATPDLPPDPLLAVVARASVPAWKVWVSPARPGEVEQALLLLKRLDPARAREVAAPLVSHPEARVAEAARFVRGED